MHKLAEICEFGDLKDDLMRDLIVIGISDENLTLLKATSRLRQEELVESQQKIFRYNVGATNEV